MAPTVLVVTSSRNLIRHVKRSLSSAGYAVSVTAVSPDALSHFNGPDGICIIDSDEPEPEVRALLEELRQKRPEVIPLLMSHDRNNDFVLDLLRQQRLNNLIARHGAFSSSSEMIDENELIVTCSKLYHRDIFGIEKYLSTWGINIHTHDLSSNEDRGAAFSDLEQFLDQIDCYGAIKHSVLLVADELMMNAIFNAPRDEHGEAKYAALDRRQKINLDPAERVQLRFACDGRNVGLSVRDQFGSLDRSVIIRYLEQCFADRPAIIEEKKGGAGLGLFMVFNSITQLTFNIHAGKATEVIAIFYVRSGARAFKASGRSLNLFFMQD